MSGFSTGSEDIILRKIDVKIPSMPTSEDQLVEKYDLSKCIKWILENKFEKVCLQFPDSLLSDSVGISLWLEKQIERKLYILGDTSYGSCCVDEVAAEHVKADAIIHFGHSCLSPTLRLPVLYIFPKYSMNVSSCVSVVKEHSKAAGSTILLIFDVGYDHYRKAAQDELSDCDIVVAEPITSNDQMNFCSKNCCLQNGMSQHSIVKLGRGYCWDDNKMEMVNVIFIGPNDSRFLYNYRISFTGSLYCYTENGTLENVTIGKSLQRRFYLVERLKDARTVGIIVGTLGIRGYLDTIERVSNLVRRKGKKCYVISVGKPTIAKLANFSEIEIYIMISCPEAIIENEKEFYQPILSVMEAEIALNERRSWSGISSSDFRDILPGAKHYVELPENDSTTEPDVSLISNKIRYNVDNLITVTTGSEQDGTVQVRADMTVDNASSNLAKRSWQGLDPMLGQVPVVKAVQGRSGIPQAYSEEHYSSSS